VKAILLQGMAFGDESKGATVDALCRKFPVDQIVRYNGGPQTAHNVVTPQGVHHTFSQFGSGMLANSTVKTHLSRFMLINPFSMMREAAALPTYTPVWNRVTIDRQCVVITPMHKRLNQLREKARREGAHGSCGVGVGVARELSLRYGDRVLLVEDFADENRIHMKLLFMFSQLGFEIDRLQRELKIPDMDFDFEHMARAYKDFGSYAKVVDKLEPSDLMLFEGAQGVLLDERKEFLPHNTWTNCTFGNADNLLSEVGCSDRLRIGCFRSYFTRHGHGPFPTEDVDLTKSFKEAHNGTGEFQGAFRCGKFDFDLAKKALDIVGGLDYLSISHLDRASLEVGDEISSTLGVPVGVWATGPTSNHRGFNCELIDRLDKVLETC